VIAQIGMGLDPANLFSNKNREVKLFSPNMKESERDRFIDQFEKAVELIRSYKILN
jgi:hypothetical protein